MRRTRRILVLLLAFLLCIIILNGLGEFSAVALVADAVAIGVLALIELRRK